MLFVQIIFYLFQIIYRSLLISNYHYNYLIIDFPKKHLIFVPFVIINLRINIIKDKHINVKNKQKNFIKRLIKNCFHL